MRLVKSLILFALISVGFAAFAAADCEKAAKTVKEEAGLLAFTYLPNGTVEVSFSGKIRLQTSAAAQAA